jgi:2-methylfumaryl-CoA isomerase
MAGILAGLRIIEASAFIAAPFAGMTLAQMGADVIRVDPLGGGLDHGRWPLADSGQSLYWAGLNKGKRSVALDVRGEHGRGLLEALVTAPGADAGILLTNLGPGAVPSYEDLARKRADVIVVQIVGNPDGTPAVDYTINCAVGFPGITGPAALTEPVNHVLPAWDLLCGTTAAMAVLAAERQRRLSGRGQCVRIALSDVAMAAAGHLGYLAEAQVAGRERGRHGNALYGSFGRDFATRDGRRVMIAAVTARQWNSIVVAMELAGAVASLEVARGIDCRREADRWTARESLFALLEPWILRRDFGDVRAILERHGVLWGPYQSFSELLAEDPRCSLANPLFAEIDQPGVGRHVAPGSPATFGGSERTAVRPAPELGSHTDEVLAQLLKLDETELDRLRAAGVTRINPSPERV